MSDEVVNLRGLDKLVKALKVKTPKIRVGILGSKDARADSQSNATIGAAHEFGTTTIPQRSFLRVPLIDHLDKELEKSGINSKDNLNEIISGGDLMPWLREIAVTAEAIVLEGFASQGYGKWAAWKNPNYMNNSGQVLIDKGYLRDSITTDIK